jgi:poly-gamma-glutamate synthesis protein (capsule biosynthesis protein)
MPARAGSSPRARARPLACSATRPIPARRRRRRRPACGPPRPRRHRLLETGLTAEDAVAARDTAAAKDAAPREGAAAGTEAGGDPSLTLSAVGDCTIGSELAVTRTPGSFHSEMEARGNDYRYPFAGVIGVLSRDDLTIANLETTLGTRAPVSKGRYAFRGEPAFAQILVDGSVELVNVANNHSYDLGVAGFDETLRTLEQYKIAASASAASRASRWIGSSLGHGR